MIVVFYWIKFNRSVPYWTNPGLPSTASLGLGPEYSYSSQKGSWNAYPDLLGTLCNCWKMCHVIPNSRNVFISKWTIACSRSFCGRLVSILPVHLSLHLLLGLVSEGIWGFFPSGSRIRASLVWCMFWVWLTGPWLCLPLSICLDTHSFLGSHLSWCETMASLQWDFSVNNQER